MYTAGDVRVEEREDPKIIEPPDAIVRLTATCICGSDLWPYRGVEPVDHQVMGHEYVGVVEEIGADVKNVKVGDFVVGSFVISDNTCETAARATSPNASHAEFVAQTIGTQSEKARIPHADGTLVRRPDSPTRADPVAAGRVRRARDRLVRRGRCRGRPRQDSRGSWRRSGGFMGILAAKQLGAERIIAMSRHPERQELARFYGATDIVEERGDEGVAKIKELTNGLGAH